MMRAPTAVVGRHVPGNHDQGNGVKSGGRRTGDRVHHSRPGVREHDTGLPGHARVAVGHVGRSLLVPRGDEVDPAPRQRIEDRDVGVAA